jgi:hypothetical protein
MLAFARLVVLLLLAVLVLGLMGWRQWEIRNGRE